MSCQAQIWQSPFMKFFLSQQHWLWFRKWAASTILVNFIAILLVAIERQCQLTFWLFPSIAKYAAYHSTLCAAVAVVFAYNLVDSALRYAHCCYKLRRKFTVATEDEKRDLSRSFHLDSNSSGKGSVLVSTATPRQQLNNQQHHQLLSSSPLAHVYLPSSSPKSLRHHQQQLQHQPLPHRSPQFRTPNRPLSSSSSGGDLSAYFSPPGSDSISRLSASLLGHSPHDTAAAAADLSIVAGSQSQQWHSRHGLQQSRAIDFSHLARLHYQVGTPGGRPQKTSRSPPQQQQQQQQQQSEQCQLQQQHHQPSLLSHEATLRHLGVFPDDSDQHQQLGSARSRRLLDAWLQGMRAWLHGTLVEPLCRQIDRVNAQLVREVGQHELTVGSASVQQLQQSATAAGIVGQLMPYLAVCEDQGYLVRRLRELASSPCLGAYRWDSGSGPGHWTDHHRQPNDANLLMQLLSAYLDRCLPPLASGAKSFSSVYLAKQLPSAQTPDLMQPQPQQPQQQPLQSLQILQFSRQPPHYRLLLLTAAAAGAREQQTMLDVAPGCRNLFYCLLFFFYYHYRRCGGRLGQVCLGESGLNLAWIFEGRGLDIEDLVM